jgi:hypothetical protein
MYTNFSRKIVPFLTMWKKRVMAGQATDDSIIRRMGFACWINKTTGTQNMFCPRQKKMVLRTRLSVTLYVHYCLVNLSNRQGHALANLPLGRECYNPLRWGLVWC